MKTLNKPDSEFLPSRQLKCDLNMSIPFSLCQELASQFQILLMKLIYNL